MPDREFKNPHYYPGQDTFRPNLNPNNPKKGPLRRLGRRLVYSMATLATLSSIGYYVLRSNYSSNNDTYNVESEQTSQPSYTIENARISEKREPTKYIEDLMNFNVADINESLEDVFSARIANDQPKIDYTPEPDNQIVDYVSETLRPELDYTSNPVKESKINNVSVGMYGSQSYDEQNRFLNVLHDANTFNDKITFLGQNPVADHERTIIGAKIAKLVYHDDGRSVSADLNFQGEQQFDNLTLSRDNSYIRFLDPETGKSMTVKPGEKASFPYNIEDKVQAMAITDLEIEGNTAKYKVFASYNPNLLSNLLSIVQKEKPSLEQIVSEIPEETEFLVEKKNFQDEVSSSKYDFGGELKLIVNEESVQRTGTPADSELYKIELANYDNETRQNLSTNIQHELASSRGGFLQATQHLGLSSDPLSANVDYITHDRNVEQKRVDSLISNLGDLGIKTLNTVNPINIAEFVYDEGKHLTSAVSGGRIGGDEDDKHRNYFANAFVHLGQMLFEEPIKFTPLPEALDSAESVLNASASIGSSIIHTTKIPFNLTVGNLPYGQEVIDVGSDSLETIVSLGINSLPGGEASQRVSQSCFEYTEINGKDLKDYVAALPVLCHLLNNDREFKGGMKEITPTRRIIELISTFWVNHGLWSNVLDNKDGGISRFDDNLDEVDPAKTGSELTGPPPSHTF